MEYVRLLHPKHFDCELSQFKSLAFKDSGSGASVIQYPCVDATGATICQHIRRYYPNVGGEPPVFWIFDDTILPPQTKITQKRSRSGDDCHHDITGQDINRLNKSLKSLLKSKKVGDFRVCDNGQARPLRKEDVCEEEKKGP